VSWIEQRAGGRGAYSRLHMFRLLVSVRRGSASNLPGTWERYPTIELARAAGALLMRQERVARIALVSTGVPPAFVEWLDR
jgi:hypothetical protein